MTTSIPAPLNLDTNLVADSGEFRSEHASHSPGPDWLPVCLYHETHVDDRQIQDGRDQYGNSTYKRECHVVTSAKILWRRRHDTTISDLTTKLAETKKKLDDAFNTNKDLQKLLVDSGKVQKDLGSELDRLIKRDEIERKRADETAAKMRTLEKDLARIKQVIGEKAYAEALAAKVS